MKILILSRYGKLGASSRLRSFQYLPWFERAGLEVDVFYLIDDQMLIKKYSAGRYGFLNMVTAYVRRIRKMLQRNDYDLLWIEKEALPWLPAGFERFLLRGRPYALDFDDAIFHNYDRHRLGAVRRIFGKRIDELMSGAALVTAGNDYLADRARAAGAQWVEFVPTVIDLDRYPNQSMRNLPDCKTIVWIGSPSTAQYLELLAGPLAKLAKTHDFTLLVIGANFSLPGVDVKCRQWSESTEVENIAAADIGIMPLLNTPWELGKCGYKLIQYMACGLPVVASPVGVNCQIVTDGENGFLAADTQAWEDRLRALLNNDELRSTMGRAGRLKVENKYCIQKSGPQLSKFLKQAGRV